jgi:hypothetical protein
MVCMILKLAKDDPQREFEFEVEYMLSLTTRQRFDMMHRASRRLMKTLIRHGHRRPTEIIKRPCR